MGDGNTAIMTVDRQEGTVVGSSPAQSIFLRCNGNSPLSPAVGAIECGNGGFARSDLQSVGKQTINGIIWSRKKKRV